jgi:hypothetical protein
MNIAEIKSTIGITQLPLNNLTNKDGSPSEFMGAWMDNPRRRVLIHKDVAAKAATSEALFVKVNEMEGPKGSYTRYIICEGKEPDMVL